MRLVMFTTLAYSELFVGITRVFGLVALISAGFGWALHATNRGISREVALGLLFSFGGLATMTDPITVSPGVFFDGRSVVVALAYPFAGWIGAGIVYIVLAAYRIWIGGAGMMSGLEGMAITTVASVVVWELTRKHLEGNILRYVLLALCSTCLGLLSVTALPHAIALKVLYAIAFPSIVGNLLGILVLSQFLQREKQHLGLLRTLEYDATIDPLTKLVNRRAFDQIANGVERRALAGEEAFSLILIDVDHFKRVNDTLGHQAGDEILKRIAETVGNVMRQIDIVARYGGEEIAVLMPNTSVAIAAGMAERARARVEREFQNSGHMRVTISAGVASYADHLRGLADVMSQADAALYRAKNDGRNRVRTDRHDPAAPISIAAA